MSGHLRSGIFFLAAIVLLFVGPCLNPVTRSVAGEMTVEKQKVDDLTSIPADAELVLNAPWARTKSDTGFPSNELYVMTSTGENITQITHHRKLYDHIAVSPDRKKIAVARFEGDSDGDGKITWLDRKTIWILDLENKEEWPLAPEYDAGWGGVDWAPDSQHIYFSGLKDSKSDIYRIGIDGTGLFNVTKDIEKTLDPGRTGKWVSDVSVSDDGKWIAFVYTPKIGEGPWNFLKKSIVAVCRTDGTQPRKVTDGGPLPPHQMGAFPAGDFDPEFSPDGLRLCFSRATDRAMNWVLSSHDVMTIGIDGKDLKRVSPENNRGTDAAPDWSHDNRIVFTEYNQAIPYMNPVIVNADGSDFHRLTKVPLGGGYVRWIPPLKK